MKTFKYMATLVSVVTMMSIIGCTSSHRQENSNSGRQIVDDQANANSAYEGADSSVDVISEPPSCEGLTDRLMGVIESRQYQVWYGHDTMITQRCCFYRTPQGERPLPANLSKKACLEYDPRVGWFVLHSPNNSMQPLSVRNYPYSTKKGAYKGGLFEMRNP